MLFILTLQHVHGKARRKRTFTAKRTAELQRPEVDQIPQVFSISVRDAIQLVKKPHLFQQP